MRITESTLRKIIREELEAVVSEARPAGNAPRHAYTNKIVMHRGKKGKISAKTGNTVYITYIDDDGKPAGTGRADLSAVKFLEEDIDEANGDFQIGGRGRGFGKEFGSRLQQTLAIKADLKKNLKRNPTPEELRKAMRAAGMRDPGEEAPMEEAAHEPAGELVHRANPNFSVYEIVKGAGVTYGGDREGYRSKTLSKVGEFELYRGDESLGTFSSLDFAKKRIAALSARRR